MNMKRPNFKNHLISSSANQLISSSANQPINSSANQLISSSANLLILLAIITSANLLISSSIIAQTPQKLSYQAIIRNSSGALFSGQAVGMRISILQGSATGTAVYVETHTTTTNVNGLATVVIGDGSLVSGTFATINWASGTYHLKIETDLAGGSSYTIVGTSQLLSVPYALNSKTSESVADNSVTSAKVADATIAAADLAANSVTTEKINAGAVTGPKIAQAGATSGQVLKWSGTTWAPATDATGGGSGGWTDDGTMIRLSTSTDSVQMGSTSSLGKFNVGGNIGLNTTSSIYFGSDATRITGITGGDMRLVADDLSMLTTGNITFGHYGDETWIEFDNDNKRVGIGTISPADRLHVVLGATSQGLSAVRGVATAAAGSAYGVYGQSEGYKGRAVMGEATGTNSIGVMGLATNTSSTGVWGEGSNQGVYGKSDLATGKGVFGQVTSTTGYSGYFDGGKFYVSGNLGIGTTTPAKKLHVNGSAQVKDTLYANVVNASKVTIMPGIANSIVNSLFNVPSSWGVLNSVTLNVPATGYVLLIASGEFQSIHDVGDNTHFYMGVSKKSDGTDVKEIAAWLVFSDRPTSVIHEVISAQAVLQVTSAGTQTFYLMGYRESGADTDEVVRILCNLTAVYFPAAYGTVE